MQGTPAAARDGRSSAASLAQSEPSAASSHGAAASYGTHAEEEPPASDLFEILARKSVDFLSGGRPRVQPTQHGRLLATPPAARSDAAAASSGPIWRHAPAAQGTSSSDGEQRAVGGEGTQLATAV